MIIPRLPFWPVSLLIVSLVLVSACSDKGGDDDAGDGSGTETRALFDPARASELAHAAMPAPGDLPGSGWEVTETDDFGDSDDEFDRIARTLPECKFLTDLGKLGGPFDDDSTAAGRAQVQIERPGDDEAIPTSVEVEIEIERTATEVQGGWGIAKSLLESDEMRECFPALMRAAMLEEDLSGVKVTIEPADPSAEPPHDGAALAFAMGLELSPSFKFEAAFEMYLWPYSNAGVSVFIGSGQDDLSPADIRAILEAIDRRVRSAGDR